MSKPFVIAIGGGTCSGKSTLTGILEEKLSDLTPVVFHMDKYFKRPAPTTVAPITGIVYPEMNHPDSMDVPRMTADFLAAIADEANKVVIIEGLFALYLPDLYTKADLKLFVDLKSDERLVRRIRRHLQKGDTFDEITSRYIDTVRFRHDELVEPTRWRADMVVNGMLAGKETEILEGYIRSKIEK